MSAVMTDWQPIETAPKDGTYVDLWGQRNWDYSYGRSIHCRYRDYPDAPGWFFEKGPHRIITQVYDPTHWMPLPKPPMDGEQR